MQTRLCSCLDPALPAPKDTSTGEPVTEVEKRIKYLVDTLQESREKIVIPNTRAC